MFSRWEYQLHLCPKGTICPRPFYHTNIQTQNIVNEKMQKMPFLLQRVLFVDWNIQTCVSTKKQWKQSVFYSLGTFFSQTVSSTKFRCKKPQVSPHCNGTRNCPETLTFSRPTEPKRFANLIDDCSVQYFLPFHVPNSVFVW